MATSKAQNAPANGNANGKTNGNIKVVMPDANGDFTAPIAKSAIDKVQVVDVDMVLQLKDGTSMVLAGGAISAMDASHTGVKFTDGQQGLSNLFDLVGTISIPKLDPILSSLQGAPNSDGHGSGNDSPVTSESSGLTASLTTQIVNQLTQIVQVNAQSVTIKTVDPTAQTAVLSQNTKTGDVDAQPLQHVETPLPPEKPGVVPQEHIVGPDAPAMALALVNLTTITQIGNVLYGSGGTPASATDSNNPAQFASQVINAPNSATEIHAISNIPPNDFIKVVDMTLTGNGITQSITVKGVPAGMSIANGHDMGGGVWSIDVVPGQRDYGIQIEYTTTPADPTAPIHQQFSLEFDVSMTTADGIVELSQVKQFVVKDVNTVNDLTYIDSTTGQSVYVLPAQGNTHIIHAGDAGVTIFGSNANDFLYGGAGNDTIHGGSGNTYFEGGGGADVLDGGTLGINTAGYTQSANGVLIDLLHGTGADAAVGFASDAAGDTLTNIQNVIGSAHNDIFVSGTGANNINGGGGVDTVSYAGSTTGVVVDLQAGTGSGGNATGDKLVGIQNVIGTDHNDTFFASSLGNAFDGGLHDPNGADTVSYANDTSGVGVIVDLSNGTRTGGSATGDTYTNIQNIIGTAFADTFIDGAGANRYDGTSLGAPGLDTVDYRDSNAAVTVNFVTGRGLGGYAEGDSYINIQNVVGSAFDDTFVAGSDSKIFNGGSGGLDTVSYAGAGGPVTIDADLNIGSGAAAGNTFISIEKFIGGGSNDTFISGAAANYFDGGIAGSDTVDYSRSGMPVTVDLFYTDGTGTTGGYATGDVLSNIANVIGSNGNDLFFANAAQNSFDGGAGNNTVSYAHSTSSNSTGVVVDLSVTDGTGTSGNFALGDKYTNIQNIIGSAFNDTIVASAAANILTGGGGSDTVSYAKSTSADGINGVNVDLSTVDGLGGAGHGTGNYADGDTLIDIQNVIGSAFNDTFTAGAIANAFTGGGGDDTVSYAASTAPVNVDLINGVGTGGYAQGDTYFGIRNVIGSTGDDTFIANNTANHFDGGTGSDTVTYASAATAITVDLNTPGAVAGGDSLAAGDTFANIENVIGGAGDDTFVASAAANRFEGGVGSDTVSYADATADIVVDLKTPGAAATGDALAAGDTFVTIENIIGGSGNDTFIASTSINKFDGRAGSDTVSYADATTAINIDLLTPGAVATGDALALGDTFLNIENITTGAGDDSFIANASANHFDGGAGSDTVSYAAATAAISVDLLTPGAAATGDALALGDTFANIENITGGSGNDTFVASTAANKFDGGAGSDTVSYATATGDITVDLKTSNTAATGDALAAGDTYANIENIIGGAGNDRFYASGAANAFDGGAGNNTVDYSKSNDGFGVNVDLIAKTGDGNTGHAGAGDAAGDTYNNIQNVVGTVWDDTFVASNVANKFDGNLGSDTVSYATATTAISVNLLTPGAAATGDALALGDTFTNIENVIGGAGDDAFIASAAANHFDGGAGSDTVSYATAATAISVDLLTANAAATGDALAAGDTYANIENIIGGAGNDSFVASTAANKFDGGAGSDTVSYATAATAITVDLKTANAAATGDALAVGDTYANIENIVGGAGNDRFYASGTANFFDGGAGNNTVDYSKSNDGFGVKVDLIAKTGDGNTGHSGAGDAAGDTYNNIQNVVGTNWDDAFIASNVANQFDGGTGSDTVSYAAATTAISVDLLTVGAAATGDALALGDTFANIENITGGSGNDSFVASTAANKFDGGAGSDTVSYATATNAITVDLKTANAAATGDALANGDTFANIENIIGGGGDDRFYASGAANFFNGGAGNNTVDYSKSNDGFGVKIDLSAQTGDGNTGHAGTGDAAGDTYANIQNVVGTNWDDAFVASNVANKFDGGTGSDTVSYAAATTAISVDLLTVGAAATGDALALGDTFANIENITGGSGNDSFVASAAANKFDGGAGSDTVSYATATNAITIDLKTANAAATGDALANGDTFANIENIIGGGGDDRFYASGAANFFNGGAGNNTVDYSKSNDGFGVKIDLSAQTGDGNTGHAGAGDAAGDTYSNIQNAVGTNWDDAFIASNVANKFDGGAGSDTVSYAAATGNITIDLKNGNATGSVDALAAGDTFANIENIVGGSGNDTFIASTANNNFDGGAGSDTVSYATATTAITVDLKTPNATASGNALANGDTYANIENITGGAGSDTFFANASANKFDGGAGTNTVDYSKSTDAFGVLVDLVANQGSTYGSATAGDATGDTYVNIQNANGTAQNDKFIASAATNAFDGKGGTHNMVSYESSTGAVTLTLNGTSGSGAGNDAANDTYTNIQDLTGGAGDDTFIITGSTANALDGRGGSDTVDYSAATTAITADLSSTAAASGDAIAAGDTYANMENIIGGSGNDTLSGAAGGNSTITGGAGADTITGFGANNTASYKGSNAGVTIDLTLTGTGQVAGSGGHATGDILNDIQNVIGSSSSDLFYASNDANKFDGGAAGGSDTVSYEKQNLNASITTGVNVDLSTGAAAATGGYAQGDTFVNIENLIGTQYNDVLKGNSAGGSTLTGGAGADQLIGQGFNSSSAANILATANTANYAGSTNGGVTVDLVHGTGTGGDAQGDTYSGIQNVIGTGSDDTFIIAASTIGATANPNTVDGGSGGSDTVSYANESNAVTIDLSTAIGQGFTTGGTVKDTLLNIENGIGGSGNDTFIGGNAHNHFDGGSGSDTVDYTNSTTGALVDAAHSMLSTTGVIVDLYNHTGTGNWADGDTYAHIQNVVGSAGNDLFISDDSTSTANNYNGGSAGTDTVSYEHASASFSANLLTPSGNTGEAAGDTYNHISGLMGSAVDGVTSTLTGDGFANTLTALGINTTNILNGGGASSGSDILDGRLGGHNTLTAGSVGNTIFEVNTDGSGNLAANIDGGVHGSAAAGATATLKIFGISAGVDLNMHSFNGHADQLTIVDLKDGINTDITIDYNDVMALGKASGGVNGVELTLNLDDHDSVNITDVAGEHWKFFGNGDYVFYADSDTSNSHALATLHTRPTS